MCAWIFVCAHPHWCTRTRWGGRTCRPVIWWHLRALPTHQFGGHYGSLRCVVIFSFSQKKAASLYTGCFPSSLLFSFFWFFSVLFLWLYLTALNCCSPGCFYYYYYFVLFLKCECGVVVGAMSNAQRRCETTTLTRHLHLKLCLLENKGVRNFFSFLFLFKARYKNKMFKCRRQFMERQTGGWRVGVWNESVSLKDNHCLGKQNKQILIQI